MKKNPTRYIIFDVETTGLSRSEGHRIVELCALEMINNELTERKLHLYFNPECHISADITRINGITNEFVKDKPKFVESVTNITNFLKDSTIIAHNAPFDIKFLEHECQLAHVSYKVKNFIDTKLLSKELFPKQKVNLDAMCNTLGIDRNKRNAHHSAVIDCELLYEVYIKLLALKALKELPPIQVGETVFEKKAYKYPLWEKDFE